MAYSGTQYSRALLTCRRCGVYIGPAMAEKLVRYGVTGVKDLVGKAQVGGLKKNIKKI